MLGEMPFQLTRRTFVGAVAAFASRPAFAEDAPIATTTLGKVRGYLQSGVQCFKDIPYGADSATTRFQPPKKARAWSGIKECIQWSARAPQGNAASASMRPRPNTANPTPRRVGGFRLPPDLGPESEDCLHLNVWTTGLRDHRKRPVLCYFHGGAYNNGTVNSELYDGVRLARTGEVVVVTVNHRLNSFGYLYLAELGGPSFSDSGNSGQLDLILSLEWIRDNIAEFGGDPTRVLIFGQSGGGAKCATLMAQPKAHNLFHRVVTMSGQQVVGVKPAVATQRAERVIAGLGLTRASLNDILILPGKRFSNPRISPTTMVLSPTGVRSLAILSPPMHPPSRVASL
jgi:para-nitrobenzyl esterase